ncbi:preprotein translocase subunit SecE [Prochlorococcus sp. MIT 1300]|uniref:preprotein translocase subunit SecE n=1 Tax=Prochlorococcus sp. MIT 1300 TaxID=3096218 RepID=UPI002A75633C|nr:preprotein translocase subunit SecE [Prochlorococcus sp. MIT 1300]
MTSPSSEENSAETSEIPELKELEATNQRGFLSKTLEELKLVVWPSRQQLFSESIAVILMVTLSAASIAAISRFYGWGASQLFG